MPAWKLVYTRESNVGFELIAAEPPAKKPKWAIGYSAGASASGGTSVAVTTPATRRAGRDVFVLSLSVSLNLSAPPSGNVRVTVTDTSTNEVVEEIVIPYDALQYLRYRGYAVNIKSKKDTGNRNLSVSVSGAPAGSTTTVGITSQSIVQSYGYYPGYPV